MYGIKLSNNLFKVRFYIVLSIFTLHTLIFFYQWKKFDSLSLRDINRITRNV
jgi:hypothetical protein